MGAGDRMSRVNRLLQSTIGEMIISTVRDPRVAKVNMVTVVGVRTSPDLRYAKVFISMLGEQSDIAEAMKGLKQASKFLRSELAHRLSLKRTPELHFHLDKTSTSAARVEEILKELAEVESEDQAIDPVED